MVEGVWDMMVVVVQGVVFESVDEGEDEVGMAAVDRLTDSLWLSFALALGPSSLCSWSTSTI
jgi:hypothetical protein